MRRCTRRRVSWHVPSLSSCPLDGSTGGEYSPFPPRFAEIPSLLYWKPFIPRRSFIELYRLTDRNRFIGEMFSSIAPRYDFLNRLLSLGVDRRWRRLAVSETVPSTGGRFLDVATGTADMALEILRQKGSGASVAGADISLAMMRIGKGKCGTTGGAGRVFFVRAPGEALPFRDASFDSA